MSYSYELNDNSVIETNDYFNNYMNVWFIYQLRKSEESVSKLDRESFKRTKIWLKKKYPELLI
jgi:hypothetical protein